ncbi:hypothetical protein N7507_003752 [Penicillium longicatenatum]|nr:hypothetical protein N7507_003752 [Penicillium longicatenatum]
MTQFKISSEVADLLPALQVVVVVAKGLDNRTANTNITSHIQTIVKKTVDFFASNKYTNAQSHPRVLLYRNTLKTVANVSTKNISIDHAVTAGAFDLIELSNANLPLELRLAHVEEDCFVPLDADTDAQPAKVDKGEILYAQGNTVLTRHMAWRQSKQALMTNESTEIMFMSETFNEGAIGTEPAELARTVAASLQDGLREFFWCRKYSFGPGEKPGQA